MEEQITEVTVSTVVTQDTEVAPPRRAAVMLWRVLLKTSKRLGLVSAPLVILGQLRTLDANVRYLVEHPWGATIGFCATSVIFIITLFQQVKSARPSLGAVTVAGRPRRSRAVSTPRLVLIAASLVLVLAASSITVLTYWSAFFGPLYYPVIASERGESAAISRIESVNRILDNRGAPELHARAYLSVGPGGGGWYMIALQGPHSSFPAADSVLRRGKDVLGAQFPKDSYVYNTSAISLQKRVQWLLYRLTHLG